MNGGLALFHGCAVGSARTPIFFSSWRKENGGAPPKEKPLLGAYRWLDALGMCAAVLAHDRLSLHLFPLALPRHSNEQASGRSPIGVLSQFNRRWMRTVHFRCSKIDQPFAANLHQTFFLLTVNGRFLFDVSKRKRGFKHPLAKGPQSL